MVYFCAIKTENTRKKQYIFGLEICEQSKCNLTQMFILSRNQ